MDWSTSVTRVPNPKLPRLLFGYGEWGWWYPYADPYGGAAAIFVESSQETRELLLAEAGRPLRWVPFALNAFPEDEKGGTPSVEVLLQKGTWYMGTYVGDEVWMFVLRGNRLRRFAVFALPDEHPWFSWVRSRADDALGILLLPEKPYGPREEVDLTVHRVDPKSASVAPPQPLKPVSLPALPPPCLDTSVGWEVPVQSSWFNNPNLLTIELDGSKWVGGARVFVRTLWVVVSSESVCTSKVDASLPWGDHTAYRADPSEATLQDHPLPWSAESASVPMTVDVGPVWPRGSPQEWWSRWKALCRHDGWPQ
jgi:hypothetical protein